MVTMHDVYNKYEAFKTRLESDASHLLDEFETFFSELVHGAETGAEAAVAPTVTTTPGTSAPAGSATVAETAPKPPTTTA